MVGRHAMTITHRSLRLRWAIKALCQTFLILTNMANKTICFESTVNRFCTTPLYMYQRVINRKGAKCTILTFYSLYSVDFSFSEILHSICFNILQNDPVYFSGQKLVEKTSEHQVHLSGPVDHLSHKLVLNPALCDLFLPHPGSAPRRIWLKHNITCKGPWVLHPYQVSSKFENQNQAVLEKKSKNLKSSQTDDVLWQ